MSKYSDLELPALMDMLIKHTQDYTRMVSYKVFSVEEFTQCKQTLGEIHKAIREKSAGLQKTDHKIFPNSHDQKQGNTAVNDNRITS